MSSTTTSTTSDSSNEEMEIQTKKPELSNTPKKKTLKRQHAEMDLTQSQDWRCCQKRDEENKENENPNEENGEPPKKRRRKMRKMELPLFTGVILHITGVNNKIIKNIQSEFDDPIVRQAFPDGKCEIIEAKYVKRLPTEKEKQAWQAETKRLSKERMKAEGKTKRQMTEEEKEIRRLRNADPEYQAKKKEMARIKREVFNQNEENKKIYKELVKEKFGETKRRKRNGKETINFPNSPRCSE